MRHNLHIVHHSLRASSRILKETATIHRAGLAERVHIVALHEEGLPETEELQHGRIVKRIRLTVRNKSRTLIVQLIKYFEFAVRVTSYARGYPISCVNVHSVALLPLGVIVKLLCGAQLVYDAHELETETWGLAGGRKVLTRFVESLFIRFVDLVIVVSPSIDSWYRKRYGLDNVATVMNCPEYREVERSSILHENLGIAVNRKILLYLGGLQGGRGIEGLLRVFSTCDDGEVALVFMGHGELEDLIADHSAEADNIFLKHAVPPHMVVEYAASADVVVAYIDNPSLNDRYCLPNKLFEYIAAGLPVIVNDAPEMRRLVTQSEIGVVLSELTVEGLRRALHSVLALDSEELKCRLRRAAGEYCWENQAEVMVAAYKEHIA